MKNPFFFFRESLCFPGRNRSLAAQSVRQFLSGAVATMVDLTSFQIAVWMEGNVFLSAGLSFFLGLLTNFFITRFYVFGMTRKQMYPRFSQFLIYVFTALVSLGIIQLFLLIFVSFLALAPLLAKLLSVPPVFIWGLLSGRYLVFRMKNDDAGESPL